jgi:uracil-DNA glycosylase family 4
MSNDPPRRDKPVAARSAGAAAVSVVGDLARADVDGAIALIGRALEAVIDDFAQSGVDEIPRASLREVASDRAVGGAAPPSPKEAVRAVPPVGRPPLQSDRVSLAPVNDEVAPVSDEVVQAPVTKEASIVAESAQSSSSVLVSSELKGQMLSLVNNRALPESERLRVLQDDIIGACTRCKLHRGRTKLVFGAGNPRAELVFVGEGPGADEDRQGVPFVGRAGELLTKMIEAMSFTRDDVYILNVVKCRPPNNRDPEPDEIAECEPFLKAQLAIIRPRVVVSLGRYATHALLGTRAPISSLRGKWFQYEGIDLMPTFHPSFLLRSPENKREVWADLQQVMRHFGKSRAP